jgi:ornithine cyclodeaminase/alanine dehydrogenase
LFDSDTGVPLAVIDGNWVTAVRTAGLSAVAAKRLARPQSSAITFVGCGVQAHSHLKAFAEIFPLQEIRAFNRGRENRDALCRSAEEMDLLAHPCDSIEEAISGADLVISSITLSGNVTPFIDANWLKPGAFVSATDLGISWLDDSMGVFDRIIIDDSAQEAQMENPMLDLALVTGDLTGLVLGEADGRIRDDERTAFVFRGFALGDLALAALAYENYCWQENR